MQPTVSVVIPTIPPRVEQLKRALESVYAQTAQVHQIVIQTDYEHEGHAATRNRGWKAATSEWVAFLDDDDTLDPCHITDLLVHAEATGADMVFPWHRISNSEGGLLSDLLTHRGIADEDIPAELPNGNFIPVTVLIKRSVLEAVDGFPKALTDEWPVPTAEDWGCWHRLIRNGYKISHLDKITWTWYHWGYGTKSSPGNTSGFGDRW